MDDPMQYPFSRRDMLALCLAPSASAVALPQWFLRSAEETSMQSTWASTSNSLEGQSIESADIINVRSFGAIGDGIADDRAAIVEASHAAAGTTRSSILYFPTGKYLVGEGSPPTLADGVMAIGDGPQSILKRGARTTYFALLANAGYADNRPSNQNIAISNLTFDSNGGNQDPPYNEWKHAVAFIGVENAAVSGCRFLNMSGDAIYLGSTIDSIPRPTPSSFVRIIGNHFNGRGSGRNGVSIIDAHDIVIAQNSFVGVASGRMPGGIDLEPNHATESVLGITIAANSFHRCRSAINAYRAKASETGMLSVVANSVRHTRDGGHAIGILNWNDATVCGNTIFGSAGPSIVVQRCNAATITGNSIQSGRSTGVWLNQCANVAMTGNTVRTTVGDNLKLENCESFTLVGNNCSSWDSEDSGEYVGLRGVGRSVGGTVTANVFDGEDRDTTIIRTRRGCADWNILGNVLRRATTPLDLVGPTAQRPQ